MIKRAAIVSILAICMTLAAGAVSSATPKLGFQLRAKGGPNAETVGAAMGRGKVQVEYKPAGRKYRVVMHGKVDDICPKDGFGTVLELRAYVSDPDATLAYHSQRVEDARKCPPKPKAFSVATSWIRISETPIYKVEIQLYEYDAQAGDIAFEDEARVEYSPSQLGI